MKSILATITILLFLSLSFGQQTVRMYGDGNMSVKINDSSTVLTNAETRNWLENSGLAFSENGEELYFRSPGGDFYQVWNVAKKEKIAEISSAEAASTPKGREVIAAFPNVFYRADSNANSAIWLSADTSVSFDSNNKFTISGGQNQAAKSFKLEFRKGIEHVEFYSGTKNFVKASQIANQKYEFYLDKRSNRLFIVANADQPYKVSDKLRSFPYCGVFAFDMNSNTLNRLSENLLCAESDHKYTTDKFYFSNGSLLHFWGEEDKVYFRQTDLAAATWENFKYVSNPRKHEYLQDRPKGWDLIQHLGTDANGNVYVVNPVNDHLVITGYDRSDKSKSWEVVKILNSTNKKNYVHFDDEYTPFVSQPKHDEIMNVTAVSPSGKYFAYLSLNNRSGVGNYASIMLYNTDEKDRVYSLNDQTKFQPYIAKGYVTDKDSEALALVWQKQREDAKQQKQADLKPQIEALKAKIAEADKELSATYQHDFELASQRKYGELLAGKEWLGYKNYQLTIPYNISGTIRNLTAAFSVSENLRFYVSGGQVTAKFEEILELPRGAKATDGDLILEDKDPTNNLFGIGQNEFGPRRIIISNCESSTTELTSPRFSLTSTPYIACNGKIKGDEVISQSRRYKQFTDVFMHFLLKEAKFEIGYTSMNSPITLIVTGKDGTVIGFDYVKSDLQKQIIEKRDKLRGELNRLQAAFDSGK
ncbi:MAG TPA: hypothetical protein PKY82_05045 [Pyrinomonadaceae bacterium]|nr:hypothetical protein [Pyrinomonadaceae bacterium]